MVFMPLQSVPTEALAQTHSSSFNKLIDINTQHQDFIHDIQFCTRQQRLVTCSSDSTIKIFKVTKSVTTTLASLHGHKGPVWRVSWSSVKWGSILASVGDDGKLILWKEDSTSNGTKWSILKEFTLSNKSINSVDWAPDEAGILLCCSSDDGNIYIIKQIDNENWEAFAFPAHDVACQTVSWCPSTDFESDTPNQLNHHSILRGGIDGSTQEMSTYDSIKSPDFAPTSSISTLLLASGGNDAIIRIWSWNLKNNTLTQRDSDYFGHSDNIQDLTWAPTLGLPLSILASGSRDGQVIIWTSENNGPFQQQYLTKQGFSSPIWRLSWSISGSVLSVSYGDNMISLWKQKLNGSWHCIKVVDNAFDEVTKEKGKNDLSSDLLSQQNAPFDNSASLVSHHFSPNLPLA